MYKYTYTYTCKYTKSTHQTYIYIHKYTHRHIHTVYIFAFLPYNPQILPQSIIFLYYTSQNNFLYTSFCLLTINELLTSTSWVFMPSSFELCTQMIETSSCPAASDSYRRVICRCYRLHRRLRDVAAQSPSTPSLQSYRMLWLNEGAPAPPGTGCRNGAIDLVQRQNKPSIDVILEEEKRQLCVASKHCKHFQVQHHPACLEPQILKDKLTHGECFRLY